MSCSRSSPPRKRAADQGGADCIPQAEGDAFASLLEGLPESTLAEQVTHAARRSPGDQEPFRDAAVGSKEHEMHHRGQLMTISA